MPFFGSGSGGALHAADPVTVTAAELKNLGNVGVVIIPAAGSNLLIIPAVPVLLFNFASPAYGTLAADTATKDLALTVAGLGITHWMSSLLAIGPSNNRATFMYPNDASDASGLPDTGSDFAPNTAIELWNWSGVNYTDGNGTLTVCCSYYLLNVVTGEFE